PIAGSSQLGTDSHLPATSSLTCHGHEPRDNERRVGGTIRIATAVVTRLQRRAPDRGRVRNGRGPTVPPYGITRPHPGGPGRRDKEVRRGRQDVHRRLLRHR